MTARNIQRTWLPALWLGAIGVFAAACLVELFTETGASHAASATAFSPMSTQARSHAAPSAESAARSLSGSAAPSVIERGRVLFARQCALCHGDTGDGVGRFAYLMSPRPRNLQQGKFKLATTQNMIPSDDDLLRTITRGMPGSSMPPWAHLPQSDLKALVAFVRQIHVDAVTDELKRDVEEDLFEADEIPVLLAERTQPGPPIVVPPEPPFDDLRWFSGRRVYLEACASCHGKDGHPVAEEIKFDDEGFPVPPRSFVNGIFKGGTDGASLYARIVKGMPGTPMPASEGNYTDDEFWDLIHYVQSIPSAGSQDRAQLRQGTFTASRVQALPSGPTDAAWDQAKPLYVALTPLWWEEDRIDGLVVQSLHDGDELALRLTWLDPTPDDRAVRVEEFRDAVAVQFALTTDPPFYMGDTDQHGGVNIWMWKADREKNIADGYQDMDAAFPDGVVDMYPESSIRADDMAQVDWPVGPITEHEAAFVTAWGAGNLVADPSLKTPVECLTARGPGTLSGKPPNFQVVQGQAAYDRGVWTVQLQRTLDLPCEHAHGKNADPERVFRSGDYLPVSFAIWDGAAGDRDGKKNISIWQKMVIE